MRTVLRTNHQGMNFWMALPKMDSIRVKAEKEIQSGKGGGKRETRQISFVELLLAEKEINSQVCHCLSSVVAADSRA